MADKENHEKKSPIFYTWLIGEVNAGSVKDVIKDLDTANTQDHIKEVVLTLASSGGWLYPAFALYDHIKASKKPVDIIVEGYCMSAAVMILQAARKRISRSHTTFMVHPSNYTVEKDDKKSYSEFLMVVDEYKRNHDLFIRLSIERSGMSKEELEKIYEPRKYLTPEEALKLGSHGLIDEIREK